MRIIELDQRSEAWKVWRQNGIGSSEAAAVVGLSTWDDALGLWKKKVDAAAREKTDTGAMARGRRLEPVAAGEYTALMGYTIPPVCCVHDEYDWLKASLDGWNEERRLVVEIKAPNRDHHLSALRKEVPEKYLTQVHHQLLVTGAPLLHYVSYSDYFPLHQRLAVVPVLPEAGVLAALLAALQEFWEHVVRKIPPGEPLDARQQDGTTSVQRKPKKGKGMRRKDTVVKAGRLYE